MSVRPGSPCFCASSARGFCVCLRIAAPDEELTHHRHRGDDCLAQSVERGRHVAPADDGLAFLAREFLQCGDDDLAAGFVLRQEAHRDGVIAGSGKRQALAIGPFAQQRVGHLNQDASAIAHQRIGADRATVIEIFQDFQCLSDNRVAFLTLDMGDKAHTAGIMLVTRVVETLGLWKSHL